MNVVSRSRNITGGRVLNLRRPVNVRLAKRLGLVGWWKSFGSSGNIYRDLMRINNGTIVNHATAASGPFGRRGGYGSLLLDGVDDRVDVPDSDGLSFTDGTTDIPHSVCAWVRPATVTGDFMLLSKRNQGVANGSEWWLGFGTTYVNFTLGDGQTPTNRIGRLAPALTAGAWTHVAATYSGSGAASGVKIYFNGVQVDNANDVNGTYVRTRNSTANVCIGAFNNGGAFVNFLNGRVDDVHVHTHEMSASDVRFMYEDSLQGNPKLLNWLDDGGHITGGNRRRRLLFSGAA